MKICLINLEYYDHCGGAGTASHNIGNELARQGYNVHIIVKSIDKNYHEKKSAEGMIIHEIPSYQYSNRNKYAHYISIILYAFVYFPVMIKTLKQFHPDIICTFTTHAVVDAFIYWLYSSTPYVMSVRVDPSLYPNVIFPKVLKRYWKYYPFIKKASSIITPSACLSNVVYMDFGVKANTIPNGINLIHFHPKILNSDIVLTNNSKVLLCVSRLVDGKGIEDAIVALPKILTKFPDIKLHIIGDGYKRQELETLSNNLGVSKNIEFLGYLPNDELTPYYQSATLFLLPSLSEGFPNVFLEAIASGLPVITTPVSDLAEIVRKTGNGCVIPMQNPNAIATAVCLLLNDNESYVRMAKNSVLLSQTYSWTKVATAYANHFTEHLSENISHAK